MTTLTDGLWNVTADEYHADRTRVRFSSLKDFDRNPELYYKRWVTGELKSSESDSLKIGSALHCSLLEPSKWEERYIIAPKVDRRTKERCATVKRRNAVYPGAPKESGQTQEGMRVS